MITGLLLPLLWSFLDLILLIVALGLSFLYSPSSLLAGQSLLLVLALLGAMIIDLMYGADVGVRVSWLCFCRFVFLFIELEILSVLVEEEASTHLLAMIVLF